MTVRVKVRVGMVRVRLRAGVTVTFRLGDRPPIDVEKVVAHRVHIVVHPRDIDHVDI